MLQAKAIKTEIFRQGDDLNSFLLRHLREHIEEDVIVAITSKVISVAEGRFVAESSVGSKEELIRQEADRYLGPIGYDCHLTIKSGLMIASAGIDVSNSEKGDYILYPQDPLDSARRIRRDLCQAFGISRLGVVLTDSHTQPLRRGVVGAALSYCGFQGVESKVGEEDLFGRPLVMTRINAADAIAATATFLMGEGGECCPLAVVKAPVNFGEDFDVNDIKIPFEEDLYRPILERAET